MSRELFQHYPFNAFPNPYETPLLDRPLNPKLRMEVPNSLGFYSSHPLLNRPRNPALSSTIRKGTSGIGLSRLLRSLFRRREKPRPKQEHVSAFEVLADGPYAANHVGLLYDNNGRTIAQKRQFVKRMMDAGVKESELYAALVVDLAREFGLINE